MVEKIIAIVIFEMLNCVRPSSSSVVVVVLRPSVPSVRRRRPSSSSSVRPSRPSVPSVRRPVRPSSSVVVNLQIQGRMHIFEKTSKYESYSLGTMKFG